MADDSEATLEGSPGTVSVLQDAVTAFMAGEADLRAVRVALETSLDPITTNTLPLQLVPCVVSSEETWERCQQLHDAPFAAALFHGGNFHHLLVGTSSFKACRHLLYACTWHLISAIGCKHK